MILEDCEGDIEQIKGWLWLTSFVWGNQKARYGAKCRNLKIT